MVFAFLASLLLQAQDSRPAAALPSMTLEEQEDKEKPKGGPTSLEVAGTRIGLYGIIRMDGYYGTGNFNHTQFTYYAQSHDPTFTPPTNDRRNWIDFTPRLSRLGVKVERDSLPGWAEAKVNGIVEFDFQNRATSETSGLESESRELPRLRHAYVKLTAGGLSLLAGQTWDLISPLWPSVNADGMMWNSGNLGDRRPQFRFGYDVSVGDDAAVGAAIAFARTGAIDRKNLDLAAPDSIRDGDASGRPMIQGRLGLSRLLGKRLDAGFWGHFAWERTDTAIAGRTHFYSASVGADLKVKILEDLIFSGEAWYGKNLSDLRGGIDQGVNTTRGVEIAARGGWAELLAQLTSAYAVAGGISVDDPRNSSFDGLAPTATPRVHNIAPYVFNRYDFGGGFVIGAEAIFWATDYLNVESGRANRYSLFVAFSF